MIQKLSHFSLIIEAVMIPSLWYISMITESCYDTKFVVNGSPDFVITTTTGVTTNDNLGVMPNGRSKYCPLQWRHNERDGASNHRRLDYLLNRWFRCRSNKHQSSAPLAFVRGIHRWPVDSLHKEPVTRQMFPFDDVIMATAYIQHCQHNESPHHLWQRWIPHLDNIRVAVYISCKWNLAVLTRPTKEHALSRNAVILARKIHTLSLNIY